MNTNNDNGLTGVTLKRPMDTSLRGQEIAALTSLCGFLNNPLVTGAEVPTEPVAVGIPPIVAAPVRMPPDYRRVFYTGRLGVGKDHVAAATGAKIFGFADPLYYLVERFFGVRVTATVGKDQPGVRACLQAFGQWGRNEVSSMYPLNPARACFITMIRSLAAAGALADSPAGVDWASYGSDKNIWLLACLSRVSAYRAEHPEARVAITNVRFENEFKTLQEHGWTHYHVMCSPAVWMQRLSKRGLTSESTVVKDSSEGLANFLDSDVTKKISGGNQGSRLHAIWNDTAQRCPSNRICTLSQFLHEVEIASGYSCPATE